jgi:hypothetical protein
VGCAQDAWRVCTVPVHRAAQGGPAGAVRHLPLQQGVVSGCCLPSSAQSCSFFVACTPSPPMCAGLLACSKARHILLWTLQNVAVTVRGASPSALHLVYMSRACPAWQDMKHLSPTTHDPCVALSPVGPPACRMAAADQPLVPQELACPGRAARQARLQHKRQQLDSNAGPVDESGRLLGSMSAPESLGPLGNV